MTSQQSEVGADQALVRDVEESAPSTSFLRWAGPVMAVWVPVCVLYPGIDNRGHHLALDPFFLFSIYAGIYLARRNACSSRHSLASRVVSCGALLLSFIPGAYVLPAVAYFTTLVVGVIVALLPAFVLYPLAIFVSPVVLIPLIGTVLAVAGFVHAMILSGLEKGVLGSTDPKAHILGMVASAVPGLAYVVMALRATPIWNVPDIWSLRLVLLVMPLPHLFIVWRSWVRLGVPGFSRLTPRRALIITATAFAAFYGFGIIRFLPDHQAGALLWPRLDPDYDPQQAHDLAFREGEEHVFENPDGRGALELEGRSFLVPAELTERGLQLWHRDHGEYTRIEAKVPYGDWISGFNRDAIEPLGRFRLRWRSHVTLRADRHMEAPSELSVLCVPDRLEDMRQCVIAQDDLSWLAALDVAVDRLEPIQVNSRPIEPSELRSVLLIAESAQGRREAPGGDSVVARCSHFSGVAAGRDLPGTIALQTDACTLEYADGGLRVYAVVGPQLLGHWEEIYAGVRRSIAAWETAAEGAEPIAEVARREGEARGRQAVEATVFVPLWRTPHRMMNAVVGDWGIDWLVS